jgi:transcription-repair coupling factor (superfamily II helicase)
LKVKDFIKVYKEDTVIQSIAERIRPNETTRLRLKGLVGSLDAVVAAATYQINKQTNIFVLHDKEEAAYFHNDLQNLMGEKEVLLFPTSYKRPYQFDETENANILMRAEILNRINHKASIGELIVTYPEALTEKVINKKSLSSNTFTAKVGEALDVEFLTELLQTYDFEPTDFVYEAGQFSVRGGILDVFSYAHDLPYRIELFGNEIDSIRTFDPVSQLSQENIKEINIIPNVQTKLLAETRQSFLSFIPKNSKIWFKDYQQTLDTIEKYFIKATENFDQILGVTDAQIVLSPEELFEKHNTFKADLKGYTQLEFGSRAYLKADYTFDFEVEAQQSFNKDFDSIVENLGQWQLRNTSLCIASESLNQINRLETIFLELDPSLKVLPINISLREGFIDKNREVLCYTDHQLFDRFHKYKSKSKHSKSKALTLKELRSLHPGDYVAHIDHGIGRFVGLVKNEVNGKLQESIRLVYRDDDLLYVSVHSLHKISKYTGKEGVQPPISKLGSQEWENKKTRVKGKVKDIAKDLITLYSKRKSAPGFAFSEDGFMQAELESSFIYEDTPDQATATEHVKNDMELSHPMDRLICGDVGFGKTEIAIRAAFKAAVNGKQVAVLVPTTILAMQHFRTFSERLEKFPIKVEYINRFRTPKQIKETLARVKEGKTEILIGTHRIVNKDVQFKDLGLLVIDEEQKFGVKVKDKLKEFRVNVDVLTLTATPIPRTLHFSLMGARDLSVIATPPPNRQPVTTEIHGFNEVIMRDAISFELRRGGQVFVVHNRINDIEQIGNIILKLVPDARIGIAHGQMEGRQLEKRMMKFIEGEYDVLVSTNIIESGLDIPNANTIIINHAHMFGLSDLHQMRGRVGRSNRKAFCYLLTPPSIGLSSESRKRLSALEEFSDLGDGFKVAMRDLDIRGAGNLLGAEQSGFISDLGFEMYHKILDEAVQELKDNEFKDLFVKDLTKEAAKIVARDCTIETDMEILIPDKYVSNISERIGLYAKLDSIKNEEKLQEFITNVSDRFGPMPEAVKDLVETVRLRWQAEELGFEKVVMKNEVMKCYFMPSENEAYFQSPIFGKIIAFVQQRPRKSKMKEYRTRLILTFNEVNSVDEGKALFKEMLQE